MPLLTKGKTNWKYILIVAILALIVGGGILVYLRYFNKEISSLAKFPEIKKPEKPKIEEETTNWKTYRNERNRFEIKYPNNWTVKSYELAGTCPGCADLYEFEPSSIKITIGGSMTWEVAKINLEQGIDGKSEDIVIAGLNGIKKEGKATKFSGYTLEGVEVKEIILNGGSIGTIFHFFTTKEDEKYFDQMLSTFRFLE
jgi:phage shock protein PspC (stress-responsive transcriptional regulator)